MTAANPSVQDMSLWRELVRHSGGYAAVTVWASALTLVNIALLTRLLGLEGYGELVLIQAYIQIFWTVFNLSSWQAIIKLGHDALAAGRRERVAVILATARAGDLRSGAAGCVAALMTAAALAASGVWTWEKTVPVLMYCPVLVLMQLVNTPTGYFRMLRQFHVLSWHRLGTAGALTAVVAGCYIYDITLWGVVLAYIICRGAEYALLYVWYVLHSRRHGLWVGADWQPPEWKELIRSSYIQNLAFNMVEHFDVFVVGCMLGTAEAGILRVIKSITGLVHVVAGPLKQVFYPVVSEVAAGHALHEALRYGKRYAFWLGAAAVMAMTGFLLLGPWVTEMILHAPVDSMWSAAVMYMAGACLALVCVPIMPLSFAVGLHERHQRLLIGLMLAYGAAMFSGAHMVGIMGIAGSYAGFYLLYGLAGCAMLSASYGRGAA